jgi:3-dehydroquinate dehydratase
MGSQGTLTRLVSPLLGGFCTFAAYASDKATAPGQIIQHELEAFQIFLREQYGVSS